MPFYKSLAFKLRERLSVFVYLALPHTPYGTPVRTSETVDLLGVMGEVSVQCEPIKRGHFPHGQTLRSVFRHCHLSAIRS